MLEMIRGWPNTLSGRQSKVFADSSMGRDSADRNLLKVKTREIQCQNERRVKSSFAGFSLLCRKNLLSGEERREAKRNRTQRRQVGPIADGTKSNIWLSFGQQPKISNTTDKGEHARDYRFQLLISSYLLLSFAPPSSLTVLLKL